MNNEPFFSIIIPTRNRANILPLAIQSVLNQTFEDFEIVASDNYSSDKTREVVHNFNDKRIKYFRSAAPLSMGESWEFALSHATGKYIAFLSDDDAHSKIYLERMHSVIDKEKADILSCNPNRYYAIDTFDFGRKIPAETLLISPFSRNISVLDRNEAVHALFSSVRLTDKGERWKHIKFPQLVNGIYSSSVIERVKHRLPRLFAVSSGDIYSCALFFNAAEKFCHIDEPLCLYCIWSGSETTGGELSFQKYPDERVFDFVPLKKLMTSPNYITNIILRARADWGKDFVPVDIKWDDYFAARYNEIKALEAQGIDVSEEAEEFETVLAQQSEEIRRKIPTSNGKVSVKDNLKLKIKDTFLGSILLRLKYKDIKTFEAAKGNFKNITECAEKIDDDFLNKYADSNITKQLSNKWR